MTGITDDIHAPVQPIGSVDITVTSQAKHGLVATRRPRKAVRSRVIQLIGFRFYNHTGRLAYDQLKADQLGSDSNSPAGEEFYLDHTMAHLIVMAVLPPFICALPIAIFDTVLESSGRLSGRFVSV